MTRQISKQKKLLKILIVIILVIFLLSTWLVSLIYVNQFDWNTWINSPMIRDDSPQQWISDKWNLQTGWKTTTGTDLRDILESQN